MTFTNDTMRLLVSLSCPHVIYVFKIIKAQRKGFPVRLCKYKTQMAPGGAERHQESHVVMASSFLMLEIWRADGSQKYMYYMAA